MTTLGPREEQVVDLLLEGCENAEIAARLNMAPRTVKVHLNRLFRKFGIDSGVKRVRLATIMYRQRLLNRRDAPEPKPPGSVETQS